MNTLKNRILQCLTLLLLVLEVSLEATKQTTTTNEQLVEAAGIVFETTKDELVELHRNLRFEPPEIDFGLWSVGVARSHKVMLVNENANRSVYLSSVSGRTPIFFSSFFETRRIPPLSNTTFDVVFLPRKNVLATDLLIVHTSFGQARLSVRGQGFECPYRLKPIVGIKAPLNALLTPEIYMYNPHERPLQIIEIYSSGGQFQLELPSGLSSAPQALWEIPPHTTKPIIRIKFHGNSAGNHTAFIRIKIASQQLDDHLSKAQPNVENVEDVLVVPVEFEILPEYGMYAANPVLDFGRLTNVKSKKPIQLKMQLKNSNEKNLIEAVSLLTGDNLMPGLSFANNDGGSLTLDAELFNKTTTIDELVMLQTIFKNNNSLGNIFSVRVRAEIYNGTLNFNRNSTIFVTGAARFPRAEQRTFKVRNDFDQPLAIFNVSIYELNPKIINVTYVEDYSAEMVLQPGETHELLHLQLKDERSKLKTLIKVVTNITDFELPLVVCNGRLHVSTHHEPILEPQNVYNTELNMGAVPLEEMSSYGFIALKNLNPINVRVVNWNFNSPHGVYFHTTSMGCLRPAALLELKANKSITIESVNFRFCNTLSEGDIMVFQIAIQSHVTELQMATLQIWTPHETITTTIVFHTWVGKLEVDQEELYFKNCFPGKVCSSDLSIRSTFQHPIHITAINFTDDSIRFPNDESKKLVFALTPNAVTRLGRIYFEPALHCHNRCYLPHDEKFNKLAFPTNFLVENNNFHFDETELRRRTDLYRQMKRHFRTISFMVNSRELRQVQLQAIIDIKWPKLVTDGAQKMQTIECGKFQEHNIHLKNPSDRPILVDYFLANPEYAQQTKLSLPVEVVDMSSSCYLTDKAVFTFNSQVKEPILLPPHGSLDVTVRFDAPSQLTDTFCTLLHIRNNLTLYEAVWISAKSVQSQFRFGNRKPGSTTPLIYEIAEKHLAPCKQQLPVIVKRTFTARNTGEVPIRIDLFMIDDQICEGYGFKVIGCGNAFELKANESRKIEIAFRPDFTQFRVWRPLKILTNLSYEINYTLYGHLPKTEILSQCMEVTVRPMWERHIRIAGILLLLTSFLLVLAAASVDADNIGNIQTALYAAREKGAIQPTFNLRNIAIKAATSKNTKTISNAKNIHLNGNQQTHQHQQQQQQHKTNNCHNTSQHKSNRRRTLASGNVQRKFSTSTDSTTPDTNEFKPIFDDKFNLELDESFNCFQDTCNCSPSSSSTSSSFKSSPSPPKLMNDERNSDVSSKKQKTPPVQQLKLRNRKINKTTVTPPPPIRNPIIELMDKDVVENENSSNTKTEPTLLKRLTESIAAAVSSKDKARTPDKSKVVNTEKPTKSQRSLEVDNKSEMCAIINNTTKTENVIKKQKFVDIPLQENKDHINDANTTQNLKQKPINDSNTYTNNKQRSNIKSSSYVGPIRNMTKSQVTSSSSSSSTVQPYSCNELSKISTVPTRSKTNENLDPKANVENKKPISNAMQQEIKPALAIASSVNVKPLTLSHQNNPQDVTLTANQGLQHGKTPGRERAKEKLKLEKETKAQEARTGVSKTLNFDADNYSYKIPPKAMPNLSLENTSTKPMFAAPIHVDAEKGALYIDLKAKNQKLDGTVASSNALPPEKSNAMVKSISNIFANSNVQVEEHKGTELGPIGTKKSPSSTPVWESVVGNASNMHGPLQPKVLDVNNSFFSNIPNTSQALAAAAVAEVSGRATGCTTESANFDFNAAQSILGNVTTASLYELKKTQMELQRQLEANEFLLNLRRKQLEDQQRQQQQQQELLNSITQWPQTSNITTVENVPWGPIGYMAGNVAVRGFNDNQNQKTLTPTFDEFDTWPGTTNASIRPPPGLSGSISLPPGLVPQQQPQQQQQQIQHNNINSNGNGNPNHNNFNGTQSMNTQNDGVRTFDPFSSLGSIWSDSWKQPNNQNK